MAGTALAATQTERFKLTGNEAMAIFNTLTTCEDNTVGVTVRENDIKEGSEGKTAVAELSVFGTFQNTCTGIDTQFYGTTTVSQDEFSQDGLDGATLQKTFEVNGYDITLDLIWTGAGEILVYETKVKNDVDIYKQRGRSGVSMRNASTTGSFIINGVDYVENSTNPYSNLSVISTGVTTLTNNK
jgi:hypothetical protein